MKFTFAVYLLAPFFFRLHTFSQVFKGLQALGIVLMVPKDKMAESLQNFS